MAATMTRPAGWRVSNLQHWRAAAKQRSSCKVLAQARRPLSYPAEQAALIEERAALDMLERARLVELQVDTLGTALTAVVGPEAPSGAPGAPAFILLHGFDSSLLEMRRLYPLMERLGDVYAVDLAGWGFTDIGAAGNPGLVLSPQQKREHLRAFIEQVVGQGRPVVILGTSLGGTIGMDFALHYPHLVHSLVLVDPQGFIDGLGLLPRMPRFLLELGCRVLQADWLRESANQMAYYNKQRFATPDARRIGKLHTFLPGWLNANISFMRSGGYAISQRIREVQAPTLLLWGRQDEILSPENADRFQEELPHAQLVWVEECGHCAHLEQPQALYEAVAAFMQSPAGSGSGGNGCGPAAQAAGELQGAGVA